MAQYGRATQAYVSGYDLSRINVGTVRRRCKRQVIANFNGAIEPARTIASVTWRCTAPWVTYLSAPTISANLRATEVTVDFQDFGYSHLRCDATLDNGDIVNQTFQFAVRDTPWLTDQPAVTAGPFSVTAP